MAETLDWDLDRDLEWDRGRDLEHDRPGSDRRTCRVTAL